MSLIARNENISVFGFNSPGEHSSCQNDIIHLFGHGADIGLKLHFNHKLVKTRSFGFLVKGTVKHLKEWGRVRFESYSGVYDDEPAHFDEGTFSSSNVSADDYRLVVFKLPQDLPPQGRVQVFFIGPTLVDISIKDMMVRS